MSPKSSSTIQTNEIKISFKLEVIKFVYFPSLFFPPSLWLRLSIPTPEKLSRLIPSSKSQIWQNTSCCQVWKKIPKLINSFVLQRNAEPKTPNLSLKHTRPAESRLWLILNVAYKYEIKWNINPSINEENSVMQEWEVRRNHQTLLRWTDLIKQTN